MKKEFTIIDNNILETLIKIPFKGSELQVALFIIRKTWGYQKEQDSLSLSQIQDGINKSRPTITSALKNLILVKVVLLVKRGGFKSNGNIYSINKDISTWGVVNTVLLVKRNEFTSKDVFTLPSKGSFTHKRKIKEKNTKEKEIKIKERFIIPPTLDMVKSYCLERKNNVNPERFMDSNETKGWVVGKVKMKDWQAAIRTWEHNSKEWNKPIEKTKEEEARDLIKQWGGETAMHKFNTKYGIEEVQKMGNIWNVFN